MNNNASLVKCPSCGADLLDWRHFNDAVLKSSDGNDFECTGRTCGKQYHRDEIVSGGKENGE